ncbi:MAG: hypothetical protein K8F30_01195, partial [Taibaiella sp.]|nr:hypothetical protein [Taibaiella sp.]
FRADVSTPGCTKKCLCAFADNEHNKAKTKNSLFIDHLLYSKLIISFPAMSFVERRGNNMVYSIFTRLKNGKSE